MTISELAKIAARHLTRMADAMIAACVARAAETGEEIEIPERRRPRPRGRRPKDEPTEDEWRRMMELNSDTRAQHM